MIEQGVQRGTSVRYELDTKKMATEGCRTDT